MGNKSLNSTSTNKLPHPTPTTQLPHPAPPIQPPQYLTINDLALILNTVSPVTSNCYALGLQLGVQYSQLQKIDCNYSKCEDKLHEIIAERLRQELPLTWLDIVRALRSDTVRENRLASEIEDRYQERVGQGKSNIERFEYDLKSAAREELSGIERNDDISECAALPHQCRVVEEVIERHYGISATPPLQSSTHSQSSGLTTATAVSPHSICDDALAHQSRIVENVINRHTSQLTEAFGNNLTYFSNKFIELGFISRYASDNILTQRGVGNGEKGSQLLSLVIENCHISHYKNSWFDKLVSVFSSEAAYKDLAISMTRDLTTSMAEEFRACVYNTPSTSHTAHPVADHLAPPGPVKSFIDYVKTFYTSKNVESTTSVVKWPPTPSKVYINLVCIDRHSVSGRNREYDEVTKAMVRDGNIDAIVNVMKGPIDFSEIGKNISIHNSEERTATDEKNSNKKRLILVEGAPGVGKSTFAWEFCRRWERGEIAQQYQLVLLLRLREERISNAKSLEDLIYHPSQDVRKAVCHELLHSHDYHALIVLEGFDELPDICRKGGSIFMDLIAGKLLPLATVLVTSRPWATQGIRRYYGDRIYQHIEILGFTGQQITEYIESTLPQDKVSDLRDYLKSHPQIRAGMYIPVNSAIVVTVYEESQASGYAMPTTLTELYTSLARTLLLRYLHGHPEYETDDIFLRTFKDLPPLVYAKFCKLCKLAYSGTLCNTASSVGTRAQPSRYSILDDHTRHQVQLIFRHLPSDFDDLGFMDSVTELYVTRGAVSSHNFLHLTFQEFFAAVHISNMSPAQQVEHFKRHKEGRLKVVLRFVAGLNKLKCSPVEMFPICDAAVGIDLIQWLFEAQSDGVIKHILGQKTIKIDMSSGMLPLDYYSLGYCMSHSQCQWVLRLREEMDWKGIEARMLAAGVSTRRGPRSRVVELKMTRLSRPQRRLAMSSLSWKELRRLKRYSQAKERDAIALSDLNIILLTVFFFSISYL